MNIEEISEMKAGLVLDVIIAEKVMGYRWIDYLWYDGTLKKLLWNGNDVPNGDDFGRLNDDAELLIRWDMPNYSSDISAAWKVVEQLRKNNLTIVMNDTGNQYRMRFLKVNDHIDEWVNNPNDGFTVWSVTMPEAICKAALLTVLVK